MTVIYEYEGWVLTDTGIVLHGCLTSLPHKSHSRCRRCDVWLTGTIFKHLDKVWAFIKDPLEADLFDP